MTDIFLIVLIGSIAMLAINGWELFGIMRDDSRERRWKRERRAENRRRHPVPYVKNGEWHIDDGRSS